MTIRLEPELKRLLEESAQVNDRTISAEIRQALRAYLVADAEVAA